MPQCHRRDLWTAERIERNDGVDALGDDVIGQRKQLAHEARFDRRDSNFVSKKNALYCSSNFRAHDEF